MLASTIIYRPKLGFSLARQVDSIFNAQSTKIPKLGLRLADQSYAGSSRAKCVRVRRETASIQANCEVACPDDSQNEFFGEGREV